MTEAQLKCFKTVVETGSFSQAAMHLYISQSAISKHIAALQQELGVTLFTRTNKRILLSSAGEILMKYCIDLEKGKENMLHQIRMLSNHTFSGTIRIGCRPSWNLNCFSRQISEKVAMRYPNITLDFIGFEAGGPIAMLNNGKIDLAFVYDIEPVNYSYISYKPLTSLETKLLYYTSMNDPRRPLTILDFKDKDFLVLQTPAAQIMAKHFKKSCEKYGFTPHFRELFSLSNILMEVYQLHGVALLDEWELALNLQEFNTFNLNDPIEIRTVFLMNTTSSINGLYYNEIASYLSQIFSLINNRI